MATTRVRTHARRTTSGRTVVGAHTRNRAERTSTGFHQRLREILDGGYNYYATRTLSWPAGPLSEIERRIAARMRMANKGVRSKADREKASQALEAAYRLVLDEEIRQHTADSKVREMKEGGRIVRVSNGRVRRFWDAREAQEWADAQLKDLPPGSRAEIFHDRGIYSEQPYSALEVNEHGHRVYGSVPTLPPFDSYKDRL